MVEDAWFTGVVVGDDAPMLHMRFARCQQWRETIRTYGFAVVQMV